MKFTDGYWQMRAGVTPHYAAQLHDTTIEDDVLTVYAPTKKLQGRGDTLNLPMLVVRFSSPMKNVIRVELVHHKGQMPRKPEFGIRQEPSPQVSISSDEHAVALTSGDLSVRIKKTDDGLAIRPRRSNSKDRSMKQRSDWRKIKRTT